jgi:preprotein translocase subunit SecE
MGPNKFVHLTFAVGALLAAFVISRAVDWGWSYFTKPNDLVVNLLAIVVAGGAAIATYRNERAYSSIVEVTRELEKVTWPTRKETSAATVVVLVTVMISAIILSSFDALWAAFTNWFLR